MQNTPPVLTSLNAYQPSLTVPSSFFTLDPVSISPANKAREQTSEANLVADLSTRPERQVTMSTLRLYECFDTQKKGHFSAVDELFDQGVWIGYFAPESRDTRYRQLPSFHELEANHKNLHRPFPKPLPLSSCSDREVVCRGCVSGNSSVIQLREICFGPTSKVVVMPLEGADDAGLFCIMLPQTLDRSIKGLESFRPFEHNTAHDHDKPFANDFMLLAIRDRNNNSGVLRTVCMTLDPEELDAVAKRNSSSSSNAQYVPRSIAKKTSQSGGQPRYKRKQQQTTGEDCTFGSSVKRGRQVVLKGPRMSEYVVSTPDGDMDDIPPITNARGFMSSEQRTPISPGSVFDPSPTQAPSPPVININDLQFTEEQARRVSFVWKIKFEEEEAEIRRTLSSTRTFRSILDSFREEAEIIPSVAQQIKANMWRVRYKLPNGEPKAVFVKPSSVDSEHSFDSILRGLVEKEEWKQNKTFIVDVELRAL